MQRKKMKSNKITHIKGNFLASGKRFGIVVSDFNEFLTKELLDGALDTLVRHGASSKNIQVFHVPGAFEVPLAVQKLILQKKFDALITLSVVIKGQTKHFNQIVDASASATQSLILKTNTPIIFGMIAANSVQDAQNRVGIKHLNKGREWALSAIEMASFIKKIK